MFFLLRLFLCILLILDRLVLLILPLALLRHHLLLGTPTVTLPLHQGQHSLADSRLLSLNNWYKNVWFSVLIYIELCELQFNIPHLALSPGNISRLLKQAGG